MVIVCNGVTVANLNDVTVSLATTFRPLEVGGVSVRRKRQARQSSNKVDMDPVGYK